ncbi:MAG: DUF3277 family protein [Candidatus Symbiopectobacterium sp. Dall1.0]|nr:DUF3277 family protein [Candidatus Symbiopectobacterium sp. Dall1.0]
MNSTHSGTYSGNELSVTFHGKTIRDFADSSIIKVTKDSDAITTKEGVDGGISRSITYGKLWTVELQILQTSPVNELLFREFQKDMLSGGSNTGPLTIEDLRGKTVFNFTKSWIAKPADTEFSNETVNRTWTIRAVAAPTDYTLGGND